jgi:hypothetical protein
LRPTVETDLIAQVVLQPIENEFDKWRAVVLTIFGAGNLIMFFFPFGTFLSHHADDALCKLRWLDGGRSLMPCL